MLPWRVTTSGSSEVIDVVPPAGIEPALDYSKQILSLQRLPVPPRGPMKLCGNAAVKQMQAALQ